MRRLLACLDALDGPPRSRVVRCLLGIGLGTGSALALGTAGAFVAGPQVAVSGADVPTAAAAAPTRASLATRALQPVTHLVGRLGSASSAAAIVAGQSSGPLGDPSLGGSVLGLDLGQIGTSLDKPGGPNRPTPALQTTLNNREGPMTARNNDG